MEEAEISLASPIGGGGRAQRGRRGCCRNEGTIPQSADADSPLSEGAKKGCIQMNRYDHHNIANAKRLRKDMTPWERRLWYCFLRSYPVRFQRQKCIDHYIVDFYCFRAKLVVELDGGGHYEPEAQYRDDVRTKELEKYGLKVLRICNLDIDRNFEGVCAFIDMEVQKRMAGV